MPVYRLTASSIISSFRVSGKRHLLLTGGRGTGKTTLLRALVPLLCPGAQEITTAAYPADRVEIRESVGGKIAVIGRFDPALPPGENRMRPVADGFLLLGVPALHRMEAGESEWAVLDELGYLENSCPEFRQAVEALLDAKRVLAIVRKQDTPFLTALCARQDAFVVDLDDPAPVLGCVVMASGLGRRFGGNKLMADFCGAPLIANALALAALPLLACRIVVTRSEEVETLCNAQGVPVLRHAQPYRSDTVRLVLAGIAVHALAQTLLMLLKLTADPEKELASIEYWIMGSLAGVTQSRVWFPVPMVISCCAVIFALHRQAMLLSVEEDEARLLGVPVGRMRFLLLTLATLVVAAVVSVTGLISFVGLLAPHCARLLAGHNRRSTSLLSGLVGSTLLLAADTIAKTVAATELPVSIFTSLLGVPFLLYLIIKPGRETR